MWLKKLAVLILASLLLAGCGVPATAPEPTAAPAGMTFAEHIAEIEGLPASDVQAIWRFDDSSPPDTPSRIVYREADLERLLVALQAVRLTGPLNRNPTAAPGDYWSYRVILFSGRIIEIHFSSDHCVSQGSSFGYQNSAAVQQAMDELGEGPNLLANDAFETVDQVTITTTAGNRIVTEHKQIEQYIRMFHWMTITGRSRDALAGGTTYTFHHKHGQDTVLRYQGNLLATAEGAFIVKPNPKYLVSEEGG